MARTKIPGGYISNGAITSAHLHASHGITTSTIAEGTNEYFTDTRVMTSMGSVSVHILPSANETYDLGSASLRWRDLFLSGDTINLGGTKLSKDSSGNLEIKDSSDNPKKIKVSEIEFNDGTNVRRLKISGGKIKSFDGSDGAVKLDLSSSTTSDIAEGTNLYFTNARADARITAADTGDLSEGSNLYFTNARARAAISATGSLSYNSTTGVMSFTMPAQNSDNITEGTSNLYFTNARVGSYLSSNGYATQSTVIAAITDSAPGTLDTLNELAAALGDDANFSTTITNSIATKLPLSGGALTGAVTTNSTFDGVDIATRDAVLTSTTTTANAALPKAGGTMTGNIAHASNFTIDAGGDITLDADGGDVILRDAGAAYGKLTNGSGSLHIVAQGADNDIKFFGNDGGSSVTALILDMSNAGAATFNGTVTATGGNSTNWNTAYGWGNHASAGYLTSVPNHSTTLITSGNLANARMSSAYLATQLGNDVHGLTNLSTAALWSKPSGYQTMVRASNSNGLPTSHGQSYFGYTITSRRDTGTGYSALLTSYDNSNMYFTYNGTETNYPTWRKLWHDGNDGSGSTLDADLLDGQEGSYYRAYANLTGTPTIPSLSGYATESYVGTQISNLVDSSPAALNTLNELAAALGDDANFSTTVNANIAAKLPLAGGTLTGTLTTAGNIVVPSNTGLSTSGTATKFTTAYGYIELGPKNTSWAHIYTDRPAFYTNKEIYVINQRVFHTGYHPNADTLTTARTINGVSFNGSANITVADSTKLPLAGGTMTGQLTISGTSPQMKFNDTDQDDFWIHVNSNIFYVLTDRDDSGGWETPYPLELRNATADGLLYGQRIFAENYHPNADTWTTARTITLGGDLTGSVSINGSTNVTLTAAVADDSHNHVISNIDGLQTALNGKTSFDHFSHTGESNYVSTTTAALLTEALGKNAFDSKLTAHKTSWSYGGNGNLTDAGRLGELAGTSWLWWTDNSADNVQGNITGLVIAPNSGGSAGKMFVYNNQGSGYSPGWREIWTSTSDGAGSGLDADLLDGNQATAFATAAQGVLAASAVQPTSNYAVTQRMRFTANDTNNWDTIATASGSQGSLEVFNNGAGTDAFMSFHVGNDYAIYLGLDGGTNKLSVGGWSMGAVSHEIYHAGNLPSLATLGYTGATNANYITNNNQLTNGAGYITASGNAATSHAVTGSAFATTSSPGSVLEYQQASGQTDTKLAPNTAWHNTIRMGHGNPYSYYGNTLAVRMTGTGSGTMFTQHISNNTAQGWRTQWDSGNDGAGSTLDADLLDGQEGAYYLTASNFTGTLNDDRLPSFVHLGTATTTGYATDDGGWGSRLNVSSNVHAKIEVSQEANSMRSHWYAHTGQDSIKFGTSTSHDVEIQRGGTTRIEAQSDGANITGNFRVSGTTAIDSGRQSLRLNSFASGGGAGLFFRDGFTYNCSITAEDHNGGAADGICISGYDGISFSTGSNARNQRFKIDVSGNFQVGSSTTAATTILDQSRNLSNIGTISSGNITAPKLYINGGTIYGVGIVNGASARFDTVDSGNANDPLELCYYSGNGVRIGPNGGDQYLSAGSIQITGTTVIDASRNLTNIADITVAGTATFNSNIYGKSVNAQYSNLYRFGGLYLTWDSDSYGTNTHHSIRSTDGDTYGDNITLNSFGNVRINFDSNANGTNYFRIGHATTGTGNVLLTMDEAGNATFAGNVTAYSDIRLKENIVDVDNALNKVCSLRGVYYNMIEDITKSRRLGLVAQEVEKVLPEVVIEAHPEDDKDSILSVDYGNIVALLIEGMKEQQETINKLTSRLDNIEKGE